jgi:hypothetical protein
VVTDGGLHGQTIRLEGDIGSRDVRFGGVSVGASAAEWGGLGIERSLAGERVGIDARRAARGVAVDADELAGMPRPAIDLATLKRYKTRRGWRRGRSSRRVEGGQAGGALTGQRRKQTLEQFDESLAGHADGIDDGQGNEPGDQAVFNRGGAMLVTQEFPEHFIPRKIHADGVARRGCCLHNQTRKIALFPDASRGCHGNAAFGCSLQAGAA